MEGSQRGVSADSGAAPPPVDQSTLPALYDTHYAPMVRLAAMYVDRQQAAEEVVQDAFVKLLQGDYEIKPGNEAAYLRRMVVNGAHSRLRRRRVRRRHTPDEPETVASAEEGGVDRSERERILTAVRQLPGKQASVIILRYYLDLSEAEIAESLGMARGSVKSHAHRGLRRLRQTLDVEGTPGDEPAGGRR